MQPPISGNKPQHPAEPGGTGSQGQEPGGATAVPRAGASTFAPASSGQAPAGGGGTPDVRVRARRAAAAHMAAAVAKPKRPIGPVLAGVGIGAVLLGALIFFSREDSDAAGTRALAAAEARVINTTNGQLANTTLEDGTTLRLGPASRLRLAKDFGEKMRVASMTGTAQFAMPMLPNPFELRLGDARLLGNGATVDIRADSGLRPIVRVREGEVTIRLAREERILGPGDAVTIESAFPVPAEELVSEAVGWTDGRFVMANRPLSYVLAEWRRWYGAELGVGDARILENNVTMDAALESTTDALAALERGGGLRHGWVGRDIVLWNAPARR